MSLLLDTHAVLWFLENSPALSPTSREAIEAPDAEVFVSDATAWELAIKIGLGKLISPIPFNELFPGRIQSLGFRRLPIESAHFHELLTLPWHHRDPFDRLLVAQARVENLTLVSRDGLLRPYEVRILW